MTTIVTKNPPDSKPVGVSASLTTANTLLIEVPDYEVTENVFGITSQIVPAVAEIIAPVLVVNKTSTTANVTIQIDRTGNTTFYVAFNMPVPANDLILVPLNGHVLQTADELIARASANNALDITVSYTVGQAEQDDIS